MATTSSGNLPPPIHHTPAWASALGVVAIVLGVFLTGFHGNEWMKQRVMASAMPAEGKPAADCPAEELEEENLSLAECEYMVDHVWGLGLSAPEWFAGAMMWLAFAGTVFAVLSIIVGGAMVSYRPAATPAAIVVFGALLLIDAGQFAAVVNAGPIIRAMYLWSVLLWFMLHLLMTVAAVAGRHAAKGA